MKPHQYPSNRRPGGMPSHDSAVERGRAKDDDITMGGPTAPPVTPIIVTRHPALVEYIYELGINGLNHNNMARTIAHATEAEVRNKHIIGVLPLRLAALAASVTEIPLDVPADLRGQELTLEQVRQYAGDPVRYTVTAEPAD